MKLFFKYCSILFLANLYSKLDLLCNRIIVLFFVVWQYVSLWRDFNGMAFQICLWRRPCVCYIRSWLLKGPTSLFLSWYKTINNPAVLRWPILVLIYICCQALQRERNNGKPSKKHFSILVSWNAAYCFRTSITLLAFWQPFRSYWNVPAVSESMLWIYALFLSVYLIILIHKEVEQETDCCWNRFVVSDEIGMLVQRFIWIQQYK